MLVRFTTKLIDVRKKKPFRISELVPDEFEKNEDGSVKMAAGQKVPKTREVDLTLRYVVGEACSYVHNDESGVSFEEKRRRALLVEKAYEHDEAHLKAEEISMIKERVGKLYGPLVCRQVEIILEENTDEKNAEIQQPKKRSKAK